MYSPQRDALELPYLRHPRNRSYESRPRHSALSSLEPEHVPGHVRGESLLEFIDRKPTVDDPFSSTLHHHVISSYPGDVFFALVFEIETEDPDGWMVEQFLTELWHHHFVIKLNDFEVPHGNSPLETTILEHIY